MLCSKLNYWILFSAILIGTGCKKNSTVDLPAANKVIVSTIAGDGTPGFADGPMLSAKFRTPIDVAITGDGVLYVSDFRNHRVRKITEGNVTTFAGNENSAYINGIGPAASFINPYMISLDKSGNLYALDQEDPRIRILSPAADVSTFAGTAVSGFLNGDTANAQFSINEEGIATDKEGNILIGDTFNNRIRKISHGIVSTIAGTGAEGFIDGGISIALFRFPGALAVDAQGNLFIADNGNFRIRKLSPAGNVSTFAGIGVDGFHDGDALSARFHYISDMVTDNNGNLFVCDENRIRKVSTSGVVSTIAGSVAGYADGEGAVAKFAFPAGLTIDRDGDLYIADANNNRIRKISFHQ